MTTEVEAKFANQDHEVIRAKLRKLQAVCEQPMRLMRRVTFETPELVKKDAFLRVRDEGHRVTMTYKQFDTLSIDGAKEIEITVSDFEQTVQLLTAIGLPYKSFQESKRETWRLGEAEIVLDEWPWLKPYIEIEAGSEAVVRQIAESLDLQWENALFGDVMAAYRAEYSHLTSKDTVANVSRVTFNTPLPDLLKS